MVPQTQPRKKRNSSRTNLLISFIFHALIVVVGFYFAARGGLLGKQLKKIAVEMVKEKPPEKPKEPEKPPEPPKVEAPKEMPKVETPKVADVPKVSAPPSAPPSAAPSAVAPPATQLPSFDFEGGKTVVTAGGPVDVYKGLVQYAFTAKWHKPDDVEDEKFVAEVQVSIDRGGHISDTKWLKKSGNTRWDNSVKQALAAVTNIDHPPPTNFPPRVIIRFDVAEQTESVFQ